MRLERSILVLVLIAGGAAGATSVAAQPRGAVPTQAPDSAECERLRLGGRPESGLSQVPGMANVAAIFGVRGVTAITGDGAALNWFASEGCPRVANQALATPELTNVAAFAWGAYQSAIALKTDGTVWEWTYSSYTTRQISVSDAIKIAAGRGHNLILKKDGTVWAWGYHGDCGEGGEPASEFSPPASEARGFGPRQIRGLKRAVAVSAGNRVSVALQADGTVWWWGNRTGDDNRHSSWRSPVCSSRGDYGKPPPQPIPQRVPGLADVVAVATGYMHHLALKRDGTVWAWGLNDCGQVGTRPAMPDGSMDYNKAFVPAPVKVRGISGAKAVVAGARHSLVLKSDGTVWAWGNSANGQLGAPLQSINSPPGLENLCESLVRSSVGGVKFESFSPTPRPVRGLEGVSAIAAGSFSSIALKNDRTVWVWGAK